MAAVLIFLVFAGCGGKEAEPEETVVLLEEESELCFLFETALSHFHIKNLMHTYRQIRKIHHFNDFHHAVQLFFDLFKCLLITFCLYCHTGNCRIFRPSYRKTLQVIAFPGKQS